MGVLSRAGGAAGLRAFTLAEGVMLLVLGGLALAFPAVASLWVTALVAVAFLVGGIVSWISTLARARRLTRLHTLLRLLVATLFVLVGGWMARQIGASPATAALQVASLALAIGVVFLVEGLAEITLALSHRQVRGWGWGLTNGVVTLILGLMILTMKFWNLMWVLGVLVGISFLFSGLDLLTFSARFHGEDLGD